jgi:hypothetical protein
MDITWPLFIIIMIGVGLWTKRQNTLHIRKMKRELDEKKKVW